MKAEVDAYLEQVGAALATAPTDVVGLRDWYRTSVQATAAAFPPPPLARREWVDVPGPAAGLRALLQVPADAASPPVIVYYHGGGYAVADPEATEYATAGLALASGCAVLSVDYRLAPEHPFPAALEDARAALAWVAEGASGLPVDSARIGLAGDSSGGALAVLAAMSAVERGFEVGGLGLVYGWFDMALEGESMVERGETDIVLPRAGLEAFRSATFGDDPSGWVAGDVLQRDLDGLPETCLVVGGGDPLRSDSDRLAALLRRSGVPFEYHLYDMQPHGFFTVPFLTDGARAVQVAGSFFRSRLGVDQDEAAR